MLKTNDQVVPQESPAPPSILISSMPPNEASEQSQEEFVDPAIVKKGNLYTDASEAMVTVSSHTQRIENASLELFPTTFMAGSEEVLVGPLLSKALSFGLHQDVPQLDQALNSCHSSGHANDNSSLKFSLNCTTVESSFINITRCCLTSC